MMMKQTISSLFLLPIAMTLICGCSKEIHINAIQDEEFVLIASTDSDTETRVSSSFLENKISFVWSEDDSLFVTVFKTGTQFTTESVRALPTFIFKLKSGAGTEKAVFSCKGFSPSEVFESGVTYTVFAAYHPYQHYYGSPWDDYNLPYLNTNMYVPSYFYYDAEKSPLQFVDKYDMLVGQKTNVTLNSSVDISFQHGITILKFIINNIGISDIAIERFAFPSSSVYSSVGANNSTGRYFGEHQCQVQFPDPLTIGPGENHILYIPAPQMKRRGSEYSYTCCPTPTYTFQFSNGESLSFEKTVSSDFSRGRLYQTSFNIDTGVAFGIPDIGGTGTDDF